VINISSIFGIFAPPQSSPYVASKFAVLGFSQSLRTELAPHRIGVTAICPGMIATSIADSIRFSGALRQRAQRISSTFRGGAKPDIVARAILDAVRTNPAVRPVGRDAWAVWALLRVAPSANARLGALLERYFGAA
jgi:short-subunit dehydrogenase